MKGGKYEEIFECKFMKGQPTLALQAIIKY